MTTTACSACRRINLPGGIRCIYCGTPLPGGLEFDLGTPVTAGTAPQSAAPAAPSGESPARKGKAAGLLTSLMLLLFKAKSLLALLKFGKIATTLFSMAVFIWADALLFGWKFGVGLAVCILVHEMGHVVVNWSKGLKQTAPMFIPFMGAVIFIKQFPDDPTIESESGAGGPIAGTLAALVCLLIAHQTGSPFWLALAHIGFVINLFNLIPFPPLDGSHVASVFSPQIWSGVLIAMLLWVIKAPSSMLWMILLVGFIFRLGRADTGRHLLAPPAVRLRMAVVYVVLCIGLGWGAEQTTALRPSLQGRAANVTRIAPSTVAPEVATEESVPQAYRAPSAATWTGRGILVGTAALLYLLTAYLLAVAAGRRLGARGLAWAGSVWAVMPALYAGMTLLHIGPSVGWRLLGAYFAAVGAALFYAIYQAARQKGHRIRPGEVALQARALAWAGAGALLVAYTAGDYIIGGVVALLAALFYVRFPWMLLSLAGSLTESMGGYERSLALRRRALMLRPDPESAAELWGHISRLNILLDRGGAAIEAIQARDALTAAAAPGEPAGSPHSIADLVQAAAALMLQDRFDEALMCCERILQASPDDPLYGLRLIIAHIRLGRIAYFRGWSDEALAQADWCLRAAPQAGKPLVASLQGMRAEALAAQGQADAAATACDQALAASREPYQQGWMAAIRGEVCLLKGDIAGAQRETGRAMRLMPGHLQLAYWRGRALAAGDRADEGKAQLSALAAAYPNEHWGRLALADVTSGAGAAMPVRGAMSPDSFAY